MLFIYPIMLAGGLLAHTCFDKQAETAEVVGGNCR